MFLEICGLDPILFLSEPGLARQETLTDMFINAKKGTRGEICNTIHWYVKTNNKYMKDYEKK